MIITIPAAIDPGQIQALNGSHGTPGVGNPFVTVTDPRFVYSLDVSTHEGLSTLVHNLAQTAYEEVTRESGVVTNICVWQTSEKLLKVRETEIFRTDGRVSTVRDRQYGSDGSLVQTLVQTINRSGGRVASIDYTLET